MHNILTLTNDLFLGKGRERAGYLHPSDESKILKIVHAPLENLNQNELEYNYIKFLEKKNIPLTHLSKCYGSIKTNLGDAYIFDRVKDYNGKTSISFKDMVLNDTLSKDIELELISELKKYIFKYNILFIDIALSNILCQEIEKDKYKLILTDGIGGKRPGFKTKLYQYSKMFTKYKVVKQWDKFIDKYNTVIKKGIKEKTRLSN